LYSALPNPQRQLRMKSFSIMVSSQRSFLLYTGPFRHTSSTGRRKSPHASDGAGAGRSATLAGRGAARLFSSAAVSGG
jgi:hypothetical protein